MHLRNLSFAVVVVVSCSASARAAEFDAATAARAALAAAGGEAYFEALADEQFASVRHRASGLVCSWGANDKASIVVYPTPNGHAAAGDDVSCLIDTPFGSHTLYATRYAETATLDDRLQSAAAAIHAIHPGARADRPDDALDSGPFAGMHKMLAEQMPPFKTAQFVVREGRDEHMTRVTVSVVDGWTFKVRYSGRVGMDHRADTVWFMSMREPLRSRGLPPYDKGPLAAPPR